VEKSPRLNWATQFLAVAYDGACPYYVTVRMAFNFLRCLALQEKKKQFMTACISYIVEITTSPDVLTFSLCNKKKLAIWHMNRPIFPTTLLIPSYDIGK